MRGRGGIVEDIRVSNILMYNMIKEGVIITMRYQPTNPEKISERTPTVRNVQLSGINIRKADRAIAIYGLEEKEVSQITFVDMQIEAKNGILVENAADVSFSDIRLEIENGIPFTGKDSKLINYDRITVKAYASGGPYLSLKNCQSVRISNCFQPETYRCFYKLMNNAIRYIC